MPSERTIMIIGIALQFVMALPTFYRESRSVLASASAAAPTRPRWWLLIGMIAILVATWAGAAFDVLGKGWFTESPYTVSYFTRDRQEIFKQAFYSVPTPIPEVYVVAEDSAQAFARTICDTLAWSSVKYHDWTGAGRGDCLGTPSDHRLRPGVTVIAQVPNAGAEAIRVALERVGIPTARAARSDDRLVVEIGPSPQ